MLRALALSLLLPAIAAAQAAAPSSPSPLPKTSPSPNPSQSSAWAGNCSLPPGLWQRRQSLKRQFDASGGHADAALQGLQSIDAQYRRFLVFVSDAYTKGRPAQLAACCPPGKGDPEAAIICALVRYLQDGRNSADAFLAAFPETAESAAALDELPQAASPGQHGAPLAALPVYSVTEELYRLIVAGNARATAIYFWLLHHSSGAWADDAADQLERLLRDHPDAVVRDWPFLKKFWNLSEGITWDVDAGWWQGTIANFRRVCQSYDPSCREILALLGNAARAAGSN